LLRTGASRLNTIYIVAGLIKRLFSSTGVLLKPIRIFRHVACEGPGYLGEFLDRQGIPWQVVCIDEKHAVPPQTDDISGLVFMGGNMSVNGPFEWIDAEIELIRRALEEAVPVMGICFGGQLVARAFGGVVTRGHGMEIGWHSLRRTEGCRCDGWLDGLPERFDSFQWHGDTFSIPPGCEPLLQSDCYSRQAFVHGDHLAMQFHLEMTERMVRGWIDHYATDLKGDSHCIQPTEEMIRALPARIEALHAVADRIYGAWIARVAAREGVVDA